MIGQLFSSPEDDGNGDDDDELEEDDDEGSQKKVKEAASTDQSGINPTRTPNDRPKPTRPGMARTSASGSSNNSALDDLARAAVKAQSRLNGGPALNSRNNVIPDPGSQGNTWATIGEIQEEEAWLTSTGGPTPNSTNSIMPDIDSQGDTWAITGEIQEDPIQPVTWSPSPELPTRPLSPFVPFPAGQSGGVPDFNAPFDPSLVNFGGQNSHDASDIDMPFHDEDDATSRKRERVVSSRSEPQSPPRNSKKKGKRGVWTDVVGGVSGHRGSGPSSINPPLTKKRPARK